ncbi:hypothetical protein crov016 [Cafeteria roenbergensis virus]|uniref:Uncharacterized protein n=1 Tax=Cafeteria roenbergensis virus (strain BV-PW1) TaxID=693272 RepID=E3T4D6_CROVB|nr:hypothetical protein crov016 [Cafeteria roenbergensis virus BV-PW1]ADO67049.1 hypothetical protein crov016 [Cafeteria roenbergensis virus BV-PW1]
MEVNKKNIKKKHTPLSNKNNINYDKSILKDDYLEISIGDTKPTNILKLIMTKISI